MNIRMSEWWASSFREMVENEEKSRKKGREKGGAGIQMLLKDAEQVDYSVNLIQENPMIFH